MFQRNGKGTPGHLRIPKKRRWQKNYLHILKIWILSGNERSTDMKISVSEKGGKNMYKSDLTRLKACMRRAEAGEDVTLGLFGWGCGQVAQSLPR